MSEELPYKLESILACESGGPLPPAPRNRRPFVQQTIEAFWREEEKAPGHWHHSLEGVTAHILATHFNIRGLDYTLWRRYGYGYAIRVENKHRG